MIVRDYTAYADQQMWRRLVWSKGWHQAQDETHLASKLQVIVDQLSPGVFLVRPSNAAWVSQSHKVESVEIDDII